MLFLYNLEVGYDNPEQEWALALMLGVIEVEGRLDSGEGNPETAFLRVFPLDYAMYKIENMIVCGELPLRKVSNRRMACLGMCFFLLGYTTVSWALTIVKKKGWTIQ